MLKKLANELRFRLILRADGPMLIKDGRYDKKEWEDILRNESGKSPHLDSVFVCQNSEKELIEALASENYERLKFYIPGTSLRGVLRSHAEKIVRTVWENDGDPICCDPFDDDDKLTSYKVSCSTLLGQKKPKPAYAWSCVICKLFGNTSSASRIHVYDSSIVTGIQPNVREGTAIDRFTGGVKGGALFQNQILENCEFTSEIVVRNFELWQLGLMAYVLRDFQQGLMQIGFGKSKGFGRVKGTVKDLELIYYTVPPSGRLSGLAEVFPDDIGHYGFVKIDSKNQFALSLNEEIYRHTQVIADASTGEFWKVCAEIWNESVRQDEKGEYRFKTISKLKEGLGVEVNSESS